MRRSTQSTTFLVILSVLHRASGFAILPSYPLTTTTRFSSSQLHASDATSTPIHLLSGFLGSGKTSTLQHLLENSEGRKIGVIVNDVASVNIDAKLINSNNSNNDNGVIELQNGCACCSIADEFMDSLDRLQQHTTSAWDAIVVELSGVADPIAVCNMWSQAVQQDVPVTQTAHLQSTITVVDASTFGTDYMTWDLAGERWTSNGEDGESSSHACAGNRKISELLVEQVEAAGLVLLNKQDMTDQPQLELAESLIRNLNPHANVITTSYGKTTSVRELLDVVARPIEDESKSTEHSHDDRRHEDTTSHHHDDDAHSHTTCNDPTCTDEGHDHSHHHHHHTASTAVENLGITNFVYRATRPFDANRLSQLLFQWPIPVKNNLLEILQDTKEQRTSSSSSTGSSSVPPFTGIVRSKGFCWIAPAAWDNGPLADTWRHNAVVYWSHAGKHLDLQQNAGTWWADVPDADRRNFLGPSEYERVMRQDFVSTEFGDRRQELVFIGLDVQREAIEKALDGCLLTDEEMESYRKNLMEMKKSQSQMASSSS